MWNCAGSKLVVERSTSELFEGRVMPSDKYGAQLTGLLALIIHGHHLIERITSIAIFPRPPSLPPSLSRSLSLSLSFSYLNVHVKLASGAS